MWSPLRNIGNVGEDVAVRYLKENNFTILERNYLKKWGEIDIVAQNQEILHFIEVKSVQIDNIMGKDVPWETVPLHVLHETKDYKDLLPEENVNYYKQKRLSRAIRTYLVEKRVKDDQDYQVDVLAVFLDFSEKKVMIRHTEDVVLA